MNDNKYKRNSLFAGYVIDKESYVVKHAIAFKDKDGAYYDLDVDDKKNIVKTEMPFVDKVNKNYGDSSFALSELVPLFPYGDNRSVSFKILMECKEDLFVMALTRDFNEKNSIPTTFDKFVQFLSNNIKSVGAKKAKDCVRTRK